MAKCDSRRGVALLPQTGECRTGCALLSLQTPWRRLELKVKPRRKPGAHMAAQDLNGANRHGKNSRGAGSGKIQPQ